MGSTVDATRGQLRLTTIPTPSGARQSAVFSGTTFRVASAIATKHLAEYVRKHSSSGEFPTSPIAGAVEQAQRQGLRSGRNFGRYGDFELGIDAKDNVIYHLVYRPSR